MKRFTVALIVAIFLDLFDYGLGWIPIAGDVIDVLGIIVMCALIGKYGVITLVELVPFADFLPMYVIAVILARKKLKGKEVKA